MQCGLGTVEEISACIHQAVGAFDVIKTVWSVATGGMIFMIMQMWKRWSGDVERLESERDAERAKAQELNKQLEQYEGDVYVGQIFDAISVTISNWQLDGIYKTPHIPKNKDNIARMESPIPGEHKTVALVDLTNSSLRPMSKYLAVTYFNLYWPGVEIDWQTFIASDIRVSKREVIIGDAAPIAVGGGISADQLGDMLAGLHKALTPFFPLDETVPNSSEPKTATAA